LTFALVEGVPEILGAPLVGVGADGTGVAVPPDGVGRDLTSGSPESKQPANGSMSTHASAAIPSLLVAPATAVFLIGFIISPTQLPTAIAQHR
jgi:hypothetical protein